MHWLIPLVSHSLFVLCSWLADTLTPTAILVSAVLVASQSIHIWGVFYALFIVLFLTGTALALATRSASSQSDGQTKSPPPATRSAPYFLANVLVAAALVPLHQYYMKERMSTVPWFNITRAPTGCLPIPSRTLAEPNQYTFIDALGNQLPYGVAVSYAMAMANTFIASLETRATRRKLSSLRVLAGTMGALLIALTAARGFPMCDDSKDGSHETMMHVDRSTAWDERTHMSWSPEARYGKFVAAVTLVGTAGVVMDRGMGFMMQGSASINRTSGDYLASFGTNVAVTGSVIVGMAFWSWYY